MEKKKNQNYLTAVAALVLIALVALMIYIAKEYYDFSRLQKQYEQNLTQTGYPYHCAFIGNPSRDTFWETIYSAAREEGAASGIYVEDFGKNLYVSYTTDELLTMAIAAKVDAVILEATGETSTRELIAEAADAGIAVGTIYRDDMESSRFSYTGVNNVSMGYYYGSLAVTHSGESDNAVMVLLDAGESAAERRLLISGIGQALAEQRPDARIDTMILDSSNTFEVEEEIRQFLKDCHDTTDIVICTNLEQTQFVSQATVDLNYVGDFTIIGSYQNYTVLEYLKSGVISANIVIDAEQMGKKAVAGLAEYLAYGHTSDYNQVDFYTVGQKAAARLMENMTGAEAAGGSTLTADTDVQTAAETTDSGALAAGAETAGTGGDDHDR